MLIPLYKEVPTRFTPDWIGLNTYPTPLLSGFKNPSLKEVMPISRKQKTDNPIRMYMLRYDSICYNPRSFMLT